ncbi:sensor histidine kinase [Niabella drilacis]|uniref:Histidine kinase n=1 Tax=Niabella drilacis (strain DSM 25811 / CCM 8410 / CCUG 62505 / LMG 26954 / E90) TaxID=1285928 RepID=A0A1G6XWC6_NIADE|nr:histidine kinase [Niabella drilacis]SDD81727.1 Histidine kinase [Niabella drilacis]
MKTRSIFQKVEILIATLVAGFVIFMIATDRTFPHQQRLFEDNNVPYSFYTNYLQPWIVIVLICYLIFLFLTQYVEIKTKGFFKITLLICTYLLLAMVLSVCFTYTFAWRYGVDYYPTRRDVTVSFFSAGFAAAGLCYLFYLMYFGLKALAFSPLLKKKLREINSSRLVSIGLSVLAWLIIFIMLASNDAGPFAIILWSVVLPYALLVLYIHIYVLIPGLPVKKAWNGYYLSRIIPTILLVNFIATVFCMATINGSRAFVGVYFLLLAWTWVVVIPLSWWIYKNQKEKLGLKTALGSSEANLGFLRSQINPHFLFNALNTLYGTALQENAERTGEGIQKLGDMMRFMLHENIQDKILLVREVAYLNNYIDLQKLRTVNSPDIVIKVKIDEPVSALQISPMLLIPFVENAFKHGISLKEPSYITIGLHTQNNLLYFDVQNSIHLKAEGDPEKLKSGIGLQNVKERLLLEYPERHELVIRQTAKDFFVHLTINL